MQNKPSLIQNNGTSVVRHNESRGIADAKKTKEMSAIEINNIDDLPNLPIDDLASVKLDSLLAAYKRAKGTDRNELLIALLLVLRDAGHPSPREEYSTEWVCENLGKPDYLRKAGNDANYFYECPERSTVVQVVIKNAKYADFWVIDRPQFEAKLLPVLEVCNKA